METQGLSKEQMLEILGLLPEETIRQLLSTVDLTGVEELTTNNENTAADANMAEDSNAGDIIAEDIAVMDLDENSDTINTFDDICRTLDSYRARFIEITEYLLQYEYTPDVKEELRQLSQGFYELYLLTEGHTLIRYKICLYQKYVNKIFNEGKVDITPYFEIAHEWAYYFLERAMENEWFCKYLGVQSMEQFRVKKYSASESQSSKRANALKPIKVDMKKLDEYLFILRDYAFNYKYLITNNDGDRAVMTITDRICSDFCNHDDSQHYLSEGLKYYLGEMRNYKKDF